MMPRAESLAKLFPLPRGKLIYTPATMKFLRAILLAFLEGAEVFFRHTRLKSLN